MIAISNAANMTVQEAATALPQVIDAIKGWFRPIQSVVMKKEQVEGILVEVEYKFDFQGVNQPMKDRELQVMPIGERSWKWWVLHCDSSLKLSNDDRIIIKGVTFRMMASKDFSLYGYFRYTLLEDYGNA